MAAACSGNGGAGGDSAASNWVDTGEMGFDYTSDGGAPDSAYQPPDSGGGSVDPRVRVTQAGEWTGSPAGGPWTLMEGWFATNELKHGGASGCDVLWQVAGAEADAGCPDCAGAWRLSFTLESGDPDACVDGDLPADGDLRTFGWAPDQGLVYLDHLDLGAWVAWFDGSADGDLLTVSYEAVLVLEAE